MNSADLTMSGRLIATEVPLDGSGNSPLLNREDFLTAVYKDGFDVNGGALTYSNIDKLVEKYKAPISDPLKKAAIDIFKAALKGGAGALDKNVIGKGAAIIFNDAFDGLPFYEDQKSVGLGIAAAGAKALSAELFPEHKVPNISFIEAEMALTGNINDEIPMNNGSNIMVEPGSYNSNSATWQYYPLYNKPLGLFALLETPKVIKSTYTEDFKYDEPLCWVNDYRPGHATYIYSRFKFDYNTFKYKFNPNAEVNVAETKIYAALVITGKNPINLELIKIYKKQKS